jgi:hypothetical protein
MTHSQIDRIVEDAMRRTAEALNPGGASSGDVPEKGPPGVELPIQNVDVIAEKVNFRLSLDPEIFFRYNVFKARVKALGKEWDGTISD